MAKTKLQEYKGSRRQRNESMDDEDTNNKSKLTDFDKSNTSNITKSRIEQERNGSAE